MQKLKEIREALDVCAIDTAALGRSRELSLALTTCQQGRMLLGKTLQLLGAATPYPHADDPKSPIVSPPADTAPNYKPTLPEDPISAVKHVRLEIEGVIVALSAFRVAQWPVPKGTPAEVVFDAAYVELTLAKNWLGMELSERDRGRKSETKPPEAKSRIAPSAGAGNVVPFPAGAGLTPAADPVTTTSGNVAPAQT